MGYTSSRNSSEVFPAIEAALESVFNKIADKVIAAYLFGSCANGQNGPMSDVDIAVLLTGEAVGASADIKIDLYLDCSRALKRNDIDIVVLNTAKNLFLLHEIVRDGIVLFDGNRGLREEFEVKAEHDFIEFRAHRLKVLGV